MTIKQYLKLDENAVAPVIGVILLVAITVMLASVIGAYTLGFSDKLSHSCDIQSFTDSITGDAPAYNATNTTDTTDTNTTDTNTTDTNETVYDVTVTVSPVNDEQINVALSGIDAGSVSTMSVCINGELFLSRTDDDDYAYPESEFAVNSMITDGPAWNIGTTGTLHCIDTPAGAIIIKDDGTDHVVVIATFLDGSTQTVYDATV